MKLKCLFALKIIIKNTNVSSETFNYTKKFQGKAKKKKLLLKFYTSGQNKNFRALRMDRYFKIVSIIEFKK